MAQQIAEAFASASPLARPFIRRAALGGSTVGIYFSDDSLIGRRFKIEKISEGFQLIETADPSCAIVRYSGGSIRSAGIQLSVRTLKLARFAPMKDCHIRPLAEQDKLIYVVDTTQARQGPQPSSEASPRRLRQLLGELRLIEEQTEYRLERQPQGGFAWAIKITEAGRE